ncbi:MAG TPA: hypothetical protein DCQ41_02255 [Cryomorphaceae bacterium]|nr:hypothetical protein [Cryomorphaceae bacterium]
MKKIDPFYALQAGWVRYKNNAGMYTAFTIVWFIATLLITTVATGMGGILTLLGERLVALLMAIVLGAGTIFLTMGFSHVARKDELGTGVEFGDFFTALRVNQTQLFGVVVITSILGQLGTFFMPEGFATLSTGQFDFSNLDELQMMVEDMQEVYMDNMGVIMLATLIQIVFGVGFMFSTYRASLEGEGPMEALKWSFPRAWSNFFRIFVLALMTGIIAIILGVLTLFIGFLVIIPWMILVQFEMYDQICDKPEGLDPVVEQFDYDN